MQDDLSSEQASGFGSKSIGPLGSVMLLINNLAGPTVVLMPALAQQAGWLAMVLTMIFLAEVSAICGSMLLSAMRRIPGNDSYNLRVEYTDIVRFYFPQPWSGLIMACFHAYLILTQMSYIISSAQVLDFASLDFFGCAYGLELWPHPFVGLCGDTLDSSTPFGDVVVLPLSFFVVVIICAPFAVRNLEDNVILQFGAILGFTVIAGLWISHFLTRLQDHEPTVLPMATFSLSPLFGTLLFNFAFMSTLPSWANEKEPHVSMGWSFFLTMSYLVTVYCAIGIIGGIAYAPYFDSDATLFTKLNKGSEIAKLTVIAYPMLQNFTSIPIFAVLIRYNLQQSGIGSCPATTIAVGLPWVLAIPFYTGRGFESISVLGGIATSSVINFAVPCIVYICSLRLDTSQPLTSGKGKYELVPTLEDLPAPVEGSNDGGSGKPLLISP